MDQNGHTLKVSMSEGPIRIKGDAVRLAQVFLNILNNAAKYTTPGGTIELRSERRSKEVIVTVTDTGIGLEKEHFNTIFEMFGQVDRSTSRSYSGLGIGLALVKRLVEGHGGHVEAFSEGLGKGTTMQVILPLLDQETAQIGDGRIRNTQRG